MIKTLKLGLTAAGIMAAIAVAQANPLNIYHSAGDLLTCMDKSANEPDRTGYGATMYEKGYCYGFFRAAVAGVNIDHKRTCDIPNDFNADLDAERIVRAYLELRPDQKDWRIEAVAHNAFTTAFDCRPKR